MCQKKAFWGLISVIAVVMAFMAVFSTPAHAATGINQQLNFQGKVVNTNGTNIPDGTYNMEFKIYQDGTGTGGGTLKWTEDYLVGGSGGVTVTSGTFNVSLGAHNPFGASVDWNQDTLYLSFQVGNTSSCTIITNFQTNCTGDGEMSPYIRLTAVPYAMNANKVGGLTASQLVQLGATQSGDINITNGTFSGTLAVQGASALTLGTSSTSSGAVLFKSSGGSNVITLQAPTTNPGSSYTLKLPTTAPALSQCLQNDGSTLGQLTFGPCSGLSIGSIDTQTKSNNGAVLSGNSLVMQSADGSFPGLVTINAQTLAGAKTFTSALAAPTSTNTINNLVVNNGSLSNVGNVTTAGASTFATTGSTGFTFQPGTNNTLAFQVQNTSGAAIFNVDTTTLNLMTNPGFETGAAGWSGTGTGASCAQNTATANRIYFGLASLNCTTASSGTTTATVNAFTQSIVAGSYVLSFYAMSDAPVTLGSTVAFTGSSGGTCTLNSTAVTSTGFQRYSCSITTTGSPTTSISLTTATNSTHIYLDSVQLVSGSTLTPYSIGSIQLRGVIDNPATFQASTNSTTALQINNTSSSNIFSVDTYNSQVILGQASAQTGKLTFNNSSNANTASIQAGTTSSSYTWTLPTADSSGCLQSNGTGTLSISACGDTNVQNFSSNGNYVIQTNAQIAIVEVWGAGGGGGGGTGKSLAQVDSGGGAGGGGAYTSTSLSGATLIANATGGNVPVTVGTGGTAGLGGTGAVGTVGGVGAASCLSSTTNCAGNLLLEAFGGGGGLASGTAGNGGGGGAGSQSAGVTAPSATGGAGGSPLGAAATAQNSGNGGAGGGTSAATGGAGGSGNYGGGGGGSSSSTGAGNSGAGGGSNQGAAGGGAGGTVAITTCTLRTGGAGGHVPGLSGGGGTAGSAGSAGGAGSAGAGSGGDGGGGGANTCTVSGTAGAGGAGGARGGGGGGGGASSGTGTQHGGAGGAGGDGYVRITTLQGSGADLAEIYCTNDKNLKSGDTVSIDPNLRAGVIKTTKSYDSNAVGIISTNPGLVTGHVEDQCVKPVLVGLAGRVPIHVSLENGPINPGDYLTPSSIPGVAMKATKAGIIIGQALTSYTSSDQADYLMAFIKNGQYNGSSVADVLAQNSSSDPSQSQGQQALQYLLAWKAKAVDTTNLSEIFTDRVTAGMEIITPSVVADKVAVNTITPSSTGNVTFDLGKNGGLIIKNNVSGQSFSIDSTGNAQFGLNLSVLGKLEADGGLTVNGDSLFGGKATFAKMAQFLGDTNFEGDVNVKGRLTFNSDTGGIGIIKTGDSRVDIKFTKEYSQSPVISASLVSDQVKLSDGTTEDPLLKEQRLFNAGYNYLISNVTTKGFTIVLNKKASEDIQFNWYAIAVNNANTFTSAQSAGGTPNGLETQSTQTSSSTTTAGQ